MKKKMKLLLVSHGALAAGMCNALQNFFGATNVYAACVTLKNGTEDLLFAVQKYLDEWNDEQVVICSDLKSGSANQTVFPLIRRPDTFLISGMNLSLLLQLQVEEHVTQEILTEIIENAKEDIVLMNDLSDTVLEEGDE